MSRPPPAKRQGKKRSAQRHPKSEPSLGGHNQLRIIGGQWRGRKLSFASLPGLRPTPDRVRETLFNWLAAEIPGAHCLDLFAGSGALGLEALSRGASSVTLVDTAPEVTRTLQQHLQTLQSSAADVINCSATAWLPTAPAQHFDVVFLDPPFGQGLVAPVIDLLVPCLKTQAWVYLETGIDEPLPALPESWREHRHKQAGQVSYRLFQVGQ